MVSRKISLGLLFLALCIAYSSAARCNVQTADRGTQTPRVWQWRNNPYRWWDEFWAPMRLLVRPQLWSRGMDHFGGLSMLPQPMSTDAEFNNKLDHLIEDFFEDPWQESEVSALEEQSSENKKCLCAGDEQQHEVTRDDSEQYSENQRRRSSQDAARRAFPRYRNSREQIQQNQRNTQGQHEHSSRGDDDMRNHQHEVRHNARNGRVRDRNDNMGSYPSNQQPLPQRDNLRQTNQRIVRREAEVRENNDEYNNFRRQEGRDLHSNEDRQNFRRFGNGLHGTMPNNRDSRIPTENSNGRFRNQVSRPVELYSLQVPGYKPSDLQVKVEGRKVRVIGRKACSCQESCSVREFERVTVLPEGIDTRNLQATINKEGTLSVQSKNNHKLSRGHYEDRDILVEGLDLPSIEDSSKNTENCVKKAAFKLGKVDKRTGKRVPITRQFEDLPQKPVEFEQEDDGVTIEVVDE